ncbi:hypothetical protein CYMTET_26473 [Cymbomonas tetramitiformis]|uniref:Amino acid transporter transmembrane domain-containing protein n=1 Tax=Cymbomonas tetramitiformis TaxID=36881 RepID=A0AAE0FRT7_9CHLO|nr:hypothetical protein CYMTET_26473 [Cymbomonas tetramitiformis]
MTAVEGPGRYWEAVNLLVTIAIAATFPLQLFPASEILAMLQAEHPLEDAGSHSSDVEETRHLTSPESNAHVPVEGSSALANSRLHNLGVTLGCISLAVMVDDVSLMVSFFGALCQTGIVIVPTLMHVSLLRQGILDVKPPSRRVLLAVDGCIITFCVYVMTSGTYASVQNIISSMRLQEVRLNLPSLPIAGSSDD